MSLYEAVFWERKKRTFLSSRLTANGFTVYRLSPTSEELRRFFLEDGHRAVAFVTDMPERVVDGPFRIPGVSLVVGIVEETSPTLPHLDFHFTPEEAEGRCPSWKIAHFFNILRKMAGVARVMVSEEDSGADDIFDLIPLGKRERAVLEIVLSAGVVGVTSREIMRRLDMSRNNLKVIIHFLRKKLEPCGYTVVSEGGRYRVIRLETSAGIQRSA